MKPSNVLLPGLVFALELAFPAVARADVPPSPGYVESCTVDKEQGPGVECLACGDAYHGDVDACEKQHASGGYTRRCRTAGASVWTEVWCKGTATAAAAPAGETKAVAQAETRPAVASSGGAGCSLAGGVAGSGWLVAVLGLGLAGARRRRSRPAK